MAAAECWAADGSADYTPLFLKPTLRIFLSVDIVNSTAFKQSQRHHLEKSDSSERAEQPWFSPITTFYHGIERRFAVDWKRFSKTMDPGEEPELWKAAGDELIYTKTLTDHRQALACVLAWMATVENHRKELKAAYPTLDLKAAAWLAGFPVNNAEVVLSRRPQVRDQMLDGDAVLSNLILLDEFHTNGSSNNGDMTRDFIGPSMDTGFRISSLATPRKFALTIDLAYMLAVASKPEYLDDTLKHAREPSFKYDGRVGLKGVYGGEPYPFFWIDMKGQDPLHRSEDDLLPSVTIKPHNVENFCQQFFQAHAKERGHIMSPYIAASSDGPFHKIPDHHRVRLENLIRKLSDYRQKALNAPGVAEEATAGQTGIDPAGERTLDACTEEKVLNSFSFDNFPSAGR